MSPTVAFGTNLIDQMAVTHWAGGVWESPKLGPLELSIHPASHVLHYGSACFEGLKAHRGVDEVVRLFRLDRHIHRMQASAEVLVLPAPTTELLTDMIIELVRSCLPAVPDAPGSLYLRPTLIGTEQNIGAAGHASTEATLFVLASPVGDYFGGAGRPLVLAVETDRPRTTPQFGMVKTGANYAMALGPTLRAASELGADQILFAPRGSVEETGASNVLLIDESRVVTPQLTGAFLHGVTRDSILVIAADLGYQVEERPLMLDEVLTWAERPDGELALSGTAAGISGVGELVHAGARIRVGSGQVGRHTTILRQALSEIHTAVRPDSHSWLTAVGG